MFDVKCILEGAQTSCKNDLCHGMNCPCHSAEQFSALWSILIFVIDPKDFTHRAVTSVPLCNQDVCT